MTFKARLNFHYLACAVATGILMTGASAWADDPQIVENPSEQMDMQDQPGEVPVSEAVETEETRNYLNREMWGIKPAVGYNNYTDAVGGRSSRFVYGFTTEVNLAAPLGYDFERWYTGLQTGFIFSHLGNPDSNTFGASSDVNIGQGGANMFTVPINAKIGFSPVDGVRISAHGGGNLLYRSLAEALPVDNTTETWRIIPNVGGDLDVGLGPRVGLNFRPDWTLAANQTIFSGTVALGITI